MKAYGMKREDDAICCQGHCKFPKYVGGCPNNRKSRVRVQKHRKTRARMEARRDIAKEVEETY